MPRITKLFGPLALAAGVATCLAVAWPPDAAGQPPFGKGFPGKGGDDKKGEGKKDDRKGEGKKDEPKKGPPPKPDAVVDAWVKVLLEKITDPHDTVRDSARGAVVAVGPPAIPALQALADGNDPAKAVAARKLIGAIQGHHGPHGPGRPGFGGPMGPGFPGMGPKGPGGFPGMGPKGPGGPPHKGDRGPDSKRGGRGGIEIEIAPMPRAKGD